MFSSLINFLSDLALQLNHLLGDNLGLTIIVIGVAVRLLMVPLFKKQFDHSKKMQELQPLLNDLKKKHKDDKTKMAEEQSKLFKEHSVNPAAGCLPAIVQLVFLGVIYQVIRHLLDAGVSTMFLGFDLSQPNTFQIPGFAYPLPGALIIAAAVSQLIVSKMMLPVPVTLDKGDSKKEVEEKADFAQDLAATQANMVYMFPLLYVVLGYQFPSGLVLYILVGTIIMAIQYYTINGWGGLQPVIDRFSKK